MPTRVAHPMPAVAIAGGGLAGLVAARHLAESGVDVTLFERREDVGGRVRTIERGGFVLDRGFQVLFTSYPASRRELDYGALDLRRFRSGVILARPGERSVVGDPIRDPSALTSTLFSGEVGLGDAWRLLRLRRRLSAVDPGLLFDGPDRSIREGLRAAGFSGRFVSSVAAPLVGVLSLDRSLSTSMAVFEYAVAMLARGAAAVPATGMGAIPAHIAESATASGATAETETKVEGVEPVGDEVSIDLGGETVTADVAIVATDPPTARDLTGVDSIPTDGLGCVTQYYALPAAAALDLDRRLLVDADGGSTDPVDGPNPPGGPNHLGGPNRLQGSNRVDGPNHVVCHSEVAPGHAPVGQSLLSATFLGATDAAAAVLAERSRDALAAWYPERTFADLEVVHTERVPFAQFAQPPGFRADLPAVDDPQGNVYLAGDYTRWSSIQGAMESGRRAALAALDDLDAA